MIRSIHFASESWAPVKSVMSAHLVKDSGIAGDRQTTNITLIEAEAVDTEGFAPGESRRNITVTGVALNPLVGKRFRVGSVLCEGTEVRAFCIRDPDNPERVKAIPVPEDILQLCR